MLEWEKARELEDTQVLAEKMDSVLMAVSEAVCRGSYAADTYEWSFTVLQELSWKLKEKLKELTERAAREVRENQSKSEKIIENQK